MILTLNICRNNCNYAMEDKMQRQQMVLNMFQKKCECVACVNNYPMMEQLKTISPSFLHAAISRMEEAKRLTGIRAFNMFNENFKCINNNFENFPCKEIAMIMFTNSLLLAKIDSLDTI